MKVSVCFAQNQKTEKLLPLVFAELRKLGIEAVEGKITPDADAVLTVGGDGIILTYGKLAAEIGKPLLGINTGRLGFMANLEHDELDKLSALKTGKYTISRRMLLEIEVKGKTLPALNDAVFMKSAYDRLPEFIVSNKNAEVFRIRADGIIFSTPTGSTAYALSAGGPLIEPEADCIEFTPLCAHTLFSRPMIFSGDSHITVRFDSFEGGNILLSADGGEGIAIEKADTVGIKKSGTYLNLIDIDGGSFYGSVHNKLMRPLK